MAVIFLSDDRETRSEVDEAGRAARSACPLLHLPDLVDGGHPHMHDGVGARGERVARRLDRPSRRLVLLVAHARPHAGARLDRRLDLLGGQTFHRLGDQRDPLLRPASSRGTAILMPNSSRWFAAPRVAGRGVSIPPSLSRRSAPNVSFRCGRENGVTRFGVGSIPKWDLIVVGGGITGAGILAEAARIGLKTLLVEAQDFASGTSSRSTKLVHGGLRYLRQGQIRVTRESVVERERLMKEARGLVAPLGFWLTTFEGDKMPGWMFGVGLAMYDALAGKWAHERHDAGELLHRVPSLGGAKVRGGYHYFDAQTDDARLTLRVLREAVTRAAGPRSTTPAPATCSRTSDGRVRGIVVEDTERPRIADGRGRSPGRHQRHRRVGRRPPREDGRRQASPPDPREPPRARRRPAPAAAGDQHAPPARRARRLRDPLGGGHDRGHDQRGSPRGHVDRAEPVQRRARVHHGVAAPHVPAPRARREGHPLDVVGRPRRHQHRREAIRRRSRASTRSGRRTGSSR